MIIIVISATLAFFFIFLSVFAALYRDRLEVIRRLNRLSLENAARKRQAKRRDRKMRPGNARLEQRLEKFSEELYSASISLKAEEFIKLWLLLALCLPLILLFIGIKPAVCMLTSAAGAVLPIMLVRTARKKQQKLLEGQLNDVLTLICNSLRAGNSFQTAIGRISEEMPDPVGREFGRVFREVQKGLSLEESFDSLVKRTECRDLEMICSAVIIQRQVGGNLAQVLENISETIRKRIDLRSEIKARTSSGMLSGYIIGLLPFAILLIMKVMNPGYVDMFFTTTLGKLLIAVCVMLETIGFLFIRKIINIKY
jgi:tight adherence protein B